MQVNRRFIERLSDDPGYMEQVALAAYAQMTLADMAHSLDEDNFTDPLKSELWGDGALVDMSGVLSATMYTEIRKLVLSAALNSVML